MQKILEKYWLSLIYLFASVVCFFWPIFIPLLIFVFPSLLLIEIRKNNLLYSIFIIFSLNTLLFIFYIGLINLLRIPLYDSTIAALNIIIALSLILQDRRTKSRTRVSVPAHGDNYWYLVSIYLLFILAMIIRVGSIAKYPAPILHDPVADAIWTKNLLDAHSITFFYSPGLHIITAFFSQASNLSIPHALNLISNSFNAFSVLSWGVATLLITRKKLLALLVSFLTFIVPIPAMLYVNSGKNSLIMAIAFIPLVFYFLYKYYLKQNILNGLGLLASLCSLFLIHYPTFGYVFLTFATIVAIINLPFIRRRTGIKPFTHPRTAWMVLAIVIFFLGCWFVLQKQGLAENNALAQHINYSNTLSISPSEVKRAFIANYQEFASYSRTYSTYYMPIMIMAILYFIIQRRDKFWLASGVFAFWVATVPLIIRLFELNRYDIIRSSGVLLFFQAFVLIVAYATYKISLNIKLEHWSRFVYAAIFLAILIGRSSYQFHSYRSTSARLETVNGYDLAAYAWINNNHINGKFLINEIKASNRAIVFPTDGGMWIPAYTNNDVSDNFANAKQTLDKYTYNIYSQLKDGNDVQKNIDQLIKLGYFYYYYDKGVFAPPLDPSIFVKYSSVVYSNPEVSIYKFH